MKKNYLFRTAMCLGIATVLSLCMTAGTYAKYVGTLTSEDNTAKVAKFNFAVKGASYADDQNLTIDLFNMSKVYDLNGTTDDPDIDNGDTETLIAPGSWGYVPIMVENTGDVTINAQFEIARNDNDDLIPLKFAVVDGSSVPTYGGIANDSWKNLEDAITDLNTFFTNNIKTNKADPSNDDHTAYLVWIWLYENDKGIIVDNDKDTDLGKDGTAKYTISLTCTATQVN